MKYKVGDRVRVKSIDWYNKNKNENGEIDCGAQIFVDEMSVYCGEVLTIKEIVYDDSYFMKDKGYLWTDEMIEGFADAREAQVEHPCDWLKRGLNLPDGYEFQDENGDIINTKKITLVKKKPQYPTTYEECCEVLGIYSNRNFVCDGLTRKASNYDLKLFSLLEAFKQLLICRDAYWKIVGWEPDYTSLEFKYYINTYRGKIDEKDYTMHCNRILAFPTSEMRDTFYENFKDLIESCKELL